VPSRSGGIPISSNRRRAGPDGCDAHPADLVFDPTSACRGARSAQLRIVATTDLLSVGGHVDRRRGRTYF
jgi:hypothetical protein